MRTSIKVFVIVATLLTLAYFPMTNVPAQGPGPAMVTSVHDEGVSDDDDPQFEYLVFYFRFNVQDAGRYRISGSLLFNGIEKITTSSNQSDLSVGVQVIGVEFPSDPLYKIGAIGLFVFDYSITYEGTIFNESAWTTGTYDYIEFDHPDNYPIFPEKFHPEISKDGDKVILKNDLLTAVFHYKVPMFEWYYTMDNKSMTKFYCKYTSIHGFVDDGRGYFSSKLSRFKGDFDNRTKIMESTLEKDRDKSYGEFASFSATYIDIPIRELSSDRVPTLANITISVLLAAGDYSVNIGNDEYDIRGGTQLKIDFDISLSLPLGVNGLTLEHEIWSESSKKYHHDFKFNDAQFYELKREDQSSTELPFIKGWNEPTISFLPKYTPKPRREEGTYFWLSKVVVDGKANQAPMSYVYQPKTKHLKLFLSFMTGGTSISHVTADPGIGLTEGSNPSKKQFIPPEEPAPPSILVTIAGWISAICLVILPLWVDFRVARKKLRELEEEYGEEL